MSKVTSQLNLKRAESLLGTTDEWVEFRDIEIISLQFSQGYKHSLGKYSKFFIELENGKLFGTYCPSCNKVYAPPRPLCPSCHEITTWQALPQTGTVQTYSMMHFISNVNADTDQLETPIALVYVQLDDTDTLFPHLLYSDSVSIGMRVRVAFKTDPVQHPIHLMHFVRE